MTSSVETVSRSCWTADIPNNNSESVLSHPLAVVLNGVLAPEGPAYKALIVDHVHALSPAGMKRLADYAKAGLPIVL